MKYTIKQVKNEYLLLKGKKQIALFKSKTAIVKMIKSIVSIMLERGFVNIK